MDFSERLTRDRFMECPDAAFASAHEKDAPLLFKNTFDAGFIACRHEFIHEIARHPSFQAQNRSSRQMGPSSQGELADLFSYHPVFLNEPDHALVRKRAFRAIGWQGPIAIASVVETITKAVTDSFSLNSKIDVLNDFSLEVSARYWALAVGLPEQASAVLKTHAPILGRPLRFQASAKDLELANQGASEICQLFETVLSDKRNLPKKSALFCIEENIFEYPKQERDAIVAMLASLSFDAVDGPAGLIANGVYWLTQMPELQKRIRDERSLIPKFWAEVSRLSPPILGLFRSPTETTEIQGEVIKAGENVLLLNAAANRDPRVFVAPDAFDLDRDNSKMMSFGGGLRACPGKSLSRNIFEAALNVLMDLGEIRTENFERPNWGAPGLGRSIQNLTVSIA